MHTTDGGSYIAKREESVSFYQIPCWAPSCFNCLRLKLPECSLHSIKSKETREVKTFSRKTSRDVGMVPSVSKEHMCLHGKINWRNKEGYHSMPNNPG